MKLIAVMVSLLAVGLTGCATTEAKTEVRLREFLNTIPATGVSRVNQVSVTPLWVETIYAQDIFSHPDGTIHIGEARLTVLSWLFFVRVRVKDFQRPPENTQATKQDRLAPSTMLREPLLIIPPQTMLRDLPKTK